MIPTTTDLVRAEVDARLAAARDRQLARQVQQSRRDTNRAERRRRIATWWERRRRRGTARPALTTAGTEVSPSPSVELKVLLAAAAQRIAEAGTLAEERVLVAMSEASSRVSPGTAAALIDWEGTEISRLRAFGQVHGLIIDELGPSEHASLLARIRGTDGAEAAELVA